MFRHSWRVGRIFGIDINIDSSWVLIFILFTWSLAANYFPWSFPGWPPGLYWVVGGLTSLMVFVSVLIHELAHSLVAIRNGESVKNITLFILGGVAHISGEPKEPGKEFSMAVVGPLSSLVLAVVFYGLSVPLMEWSVPIGASARYLAIINTVLAVFNMMPGFPMDGGRVLRSIIWKITGDLKKATRVASLTGQGFAFFLIILGILQILRGNFGGLWLVFIGWFLHSAAARSYEQIRISSALEGLRARDLMTSDFATVSARLPLQSLVDDYILKRKERVFLVVDGGTLEGIVCLEDVKRAPRETWAGSDVGSVMTPKDKLESVSPDTEGQKVLEKLAGMNIHQVPVVDGGRIAGIVCRNDLLKTIRLRSELGM